MAVKYVFVTGGVVSGLERESRRRPLDGFLKPEDTK